MSSLGRPIHLSTPFICFSLSHANILCTQKRARASAAFVYFLENNEFIQTSDFIFIAKGFFFAIVATRGLTHTDQVGACSIFIEITYFLNPITLMPEKKVV